MSLALGISSAWTKGYVSSFHFAVTWWQTLNLEASARNGWSLRRSFKYDWLTSQCNRIATRRAFVRPSDIMRHPGKLVACCSTAMSIITFFAGPLFVTGDGLNSARTTLSWIANQLPMLLDQIMMDDFASLIRQTSPGSPTMQVEQGIRREAANVRTELGNRTITAAVVPARASASYAEATTSSTPSPDAKAPPKKTPRIEVVWLFDQPGGPSLLELSRGDKDVTVRGFLLGGKNISDQPLTDVQGILKPDTSHGNIELNLTLDGNQADGSVHTIPPGAQFSLVYTFPTHPKGLSTNSFLEKFGGVIFTFHYTHAGAQTTFICHFSASRFKTDLQTVEAAPSPLRQTPPGPQKSTSVPFG
jgi:hypothetical protein